MECTICDSTRVNLGTGNKNGRIIFIGDSPKESAVKCSNVITDASWTYLRKCLQIVGIDENDCYFTNAVKCRKVVKDRDWDRDREPVTNEIKSCEKILSEEIKKLENKKLIVLLGNVPAKAVLNKTGITKFRGEIISSEKYGCNTLSTFNPNALINDDSKEEFFLSDIRKIKDYLENKSTLTERKYVFVQDMETFEQAIKRLNEVDEIAVDIETTGFDFLRDYIVSINFSWKEGTGITIPLLKPREIPLVKVKVKKVKKTDEKVEVEEEQKELPILITKNDWFWDEKQEYVLSRIKEVMANKAKKILHNGKFDIKFLIQNEMPVNNFYFDTMLGSYILNENLRGMYDLKTLAGLHTNMGGYEKGLDKFWLEHKHIKHQFIYIPQNVLTEYGAGDADATIRLYNIFKEMLKKEDLERTFFHLIMPISDLLIGVEMDGIQIDLDYTNRLKEELSTEISRLKDEIKVLTKDININSHTQLRKLFFEDLGLPVVKKTIHPTNPQPSTDEEVLEKLAERHPIPKKILMYRKLSKLLGTYVNSITENLDSNQRVHTDYLIHGTVTGRLSSQRPAMQTIPRDDKRIKKMFISRPGWKLVEADFAQIEFRLWGNYANDPVMIKDLESGVDIHKLTASTVFAIPIEQVTKEQRQQAKNAVFGLMYGRGARSVAEEFGMSVQEAQKIVKVFFNKYPKAKQWLADTIMFAKDKGYVRNMFGRYRRIPQINGRDEYLRSEAERQAINSRIQSAASDLTCLAGVRIMRKFKEINYKGILCLLVHDSLMFEIPESELDESIKIIKEEMEKKIEGVIVPIVAEFKIGNRWGELKDL